MKRSPCMGCENAGCGSYHDHCQKYQEWKEGKKAPKNPEEDYIEHRARWRRKKGENG